MGATAVGKTDLALELASLIQSKKQTAVGILNGDSVQIYKELNIGSAKPDFSNYPDINFYLFNELKAPQTGTAGFFRKRAFETLQNKLPEETIFIVGGSGFYLQALEKGMYPVEKLSLQKKMTDSQFKNSNLNLDSPSILPSHSDLSPHSICYSRKSGNLKKKPQSPNQTNQLYQALKQKDPETAQQISPKDRYRVLRALDLMQTEGKTVSQIKKEFKEQQLPWPYLKIGLQIPKEQLLKRVQERARAMLKKGLIEETQALAEKGFKSWKPLSSVGYKEALLYLEGKIKRENLEGLIVSKTMQLAKKQKTWFKKDKNIQWLDGSLPSLKVYKRFFK